MDDASAAYERCKAKAESEPVQFLMQQVRALRYLGSWEKANPQANVSLKLSSVEGDLVVFVKHKYNQYYMLQSHKEDKDPIWVFWQAGPIKPTKPEVVASLGEFFVAELVQNIPGKDQHLTAYEYNIFGLPPGSKYLKVQATPLVPELPKK